jgi:hypothetical protein
MENKVGRPTVMTDETVSKLEEVFALGGTDEEACFFANISRQTLYDYQNKYPEFIDRKEQLKQNPFLKARRTIVESLDKPIHAFEYMKRKKKDEFSDRVEHTGAEGSDLVLNINSSIAKKNGIY